ncbi:MAG TPA: hypothetical protein PLD99_01205 [Parcubacteria group bacterium]|nr:hypothetical protein [Parcubacteria group bacterium]
MLTALLVLLILTAWFLAAGLWFVKSGTIVAVLRFGRFDRVARPGPNIIIPIFESGERFSTQTHQTEYPLPDSSGKKTPFRILQKGLREAKFYKLKDPNLDPSDPESYEFVYVDEFIKENGVQNTTLLAAMENDPLHSPLTSEVAVVAEWNLYAEMIRVQRFIENIEPRDGRTREEEVDKRIEDVIAKTLQEFLGEITVGHARDRFPLLNGLIKLRLEELVGEHLTNGVPDEKAWGINVTKGYIKNIDPGHTVNKQRSEAAGSVSEMQKTINAAEAEAVATVKAGNAEAKKIEAVGKATKEATIMAGDAEAHRIRVTGDATKDAMMKQNDARADEIERVVKPSAADPLMVEVVKAHAYRDNGTVIAVGGTPLINTSPK